LEKLTYLFLNLFFYISLYIANGYVKNIRQFIFFGKNAKKMVVFGLGISRKYKKHKYI